MQVNKDNKGVNTTNDEYVPTQLEMWKFYWRFIKIDWYILIGLNI